jgi:chromosome transmission fidelity protein 18
VKVDHLGITYLCSNVQFIKAKNLEVTESIIRGATTGIKEADTSTVSVLNDLFTPISRKRAKDLGMSEEAENKYVHRLGRDIEASGSMDKIALGTTLDTDHSYIHSTLI